MKYVIVSGVQLSLVTIRKKLMINFNYLLISVKKNISFKVNWALSIRFLENH